MNEIEVSGASREQARAHADARSKERFLDTLASSKRDSRIHAEMRHRELWLRIDRPAQHNALALDMLDSLATVLEIASAELAGTEDPDWLRLVVLTGTGDDSFAAGGDLKELDAMRSASASEAMSQRGMRALNAVREFPQPVIAGLNGAARGGGAELALACDWRVGHERSALGFIQGRLNLSPAWGGGTDLLAKLGPSRCLQLLAEAELISAEEAQRLGLLEVLLPSSAEGFAASLAQYVAKLSLRPAQVLQAHKALALAHRHGQAHDQVQALESALLVRTWTHDDHWRAASAVLKK